MVKGEIIPKNNKEAKPHLAFDCSKLLARALDILEQITPGFNPTLVRLKLTMPIPGS